MGPTFWLWYRSVAWSRREISAFSFASAVSYDQLSLSTLNFSCFNEIQAKIDTLFTRSRNRKTVNVDLHGKVLIQPDKAGCGYAQTWICPGIRPDLDPFRFGTVRICFRPERSGSTRTGSTQIWIRPDLITTRAIWIPPYWIHPDLDPLVSDSDDNGSDPTGMDLHRDLDLIQSEWIRTDMDPIGSGSGSRTDLDLLLSCGKIFPVAKTIFFFAARFFMSLITICSRAARSFLSLKLFALLRQHFSCR
jgi:hypothetical protein